MTTARRLNIALFAVAISMTRQLKVLLQRITGSLEAAQDLLQDVYERVLKCSITDPENSSAVVYQIAHNVGRDWQRRNWRCPVEYGTDIEDMPQIADAITPERELIARELCDRLVAILPVRCRQPLNLIRREGYSYKEAAATLNITESAVKTRLRDARLLLVTARKAALERTRGAEQEIDVVANTDRIVSIIQTAFEQLSPRFRDVLVLRRMHGYSYAQIAAELRISQRTVKKRLIKASLLLEQALEEQNSEADD